MGKSKSDNKKKKKSSQLVIRIEEAERHAFVQLCDQMDTSAAREIRRFMRDWVAKNAPSAEKVAGVEAEPETAGDQAEPLPYAPVEAPEKPARRKRKRKQAEVPA